MIRDDVLARYRPLRAAIQRVLRDAPQACTKADLRRAMSWIAPWADESQLAGDMLDMMMDIALFEANPRGQRAFDRCLKRKSKSLSGEDSELAGNMGRAWFSLFRVGEWHHAAGLWLQDILDGDRRFWLMDEGLEASAKPNLIFGVRLFDAGPFHASFGIITQPGDELLGACLAAKARRVPLTLPLPLAAMAYAEHLAEDVPDNDEEYDVLAGLAELLMSHPSSLIENEGSAPRRRTTSKLPKQRRDQQSFDCRTGREQRAAAYRLLAQC